ncbi:MAG: aminoacyl-tRNA hydrolase [bacterium]|nr:aminoacyl-tRNA hydrolase [bacterium]
MIRITSTLFIDETELHWDFIRSSGPGGQNVNKVATAVQLRFNVKVSPSLPGDVKKRLIRLAGRRMTLRGELLIEAHRHRHQERNREDALDRLIQLIVRATHKPKRRIATKPSAASKTRRMDHKQRHGQKKKTRQKVTDY